MRQGSAFLHGLRNVGIAKLVRTRRVPDEPWRSDRVTTAVGICPKQSSFYSWGTRQNNIPAAGGLKEGSPVILRRLLPVRNPIGFLEIPGLPPMPRVSSIPSVPHLPLSVEILRKTWNFICDCKLWGRIGLRERQIRSSDWSTGSTLRLCRRLL